MADDLHVWMDGSRESDRRLMAKFLAFLAAIGLCPFRYTKDYNRVEVWVPKRFTFDDATYQTAYTHYTFPGWYLRDEDSMSKSEVRRLEVMGGG